jgi:Fe-S-cluster containining protein
VTDEPALAAGDFTTWLTDMQDALRGERGADVPCNGCTACCRSSQFVHIEPDEADTLAHIPPELLFQTPKRPPGHVLMGYDEQGHCPMLVDDRCSIYEHRPRTCRAYDCRVFAATGVEVDDDKPDLARRARRWRFTYANNAARSQHEALQAEAASISDSVNATQHAIRALSAHPPHELA